MANNMQHDGESRQKGSYCTARVRNKGKERLQQWEEDSGEMTREKRGNKWEWCECVPSGLSGLRSLP